MINLQINGKQHAVDVDPEMPLLWVLRDTLGLTGTKFGCGIAQCGACTVQINGVAMRSCVTPVAAVADKQVRTIEALTESGDSAIQRAWIEHEVPQCGYCQPGMMMAADALLKKISHPTDDEINVAITNICRCGTYARIRKAIHAAAGEVSGSAQS